MTTLEAAPLTKMDRAEALEQWRHYTAAIKEGRAAPGDRDAATAFHNLAQGRAVLDIDQAMTHGGLLDSGLPRFALARADAAWCGLSWSFTKVWVEPRKWSPRISTAVHAWGGWDFDARRRDAWAFPSLVRVQETNPNHRQLRAMLPTIPPHLRPRHNIANYHVLWEAEWEPDTAPRDPFLLRQIGRSRLFTVLAHWDLTEVERSLLVGLRAGTEEA